MPEGWCECTPALVASLSELRRDHGPARGHPTSDTLVALANFGDRPVSVSADLLGPARARHVHSTAGLDRVGLPAWGFLWVATA